jgi:hypothetical protein
MQGLFTVYLCGSSKQGGGDTLVHFFINPQIFTKYCTTLSQNSPKSHFCKGCFTNLNWDILFYNSVYYAKTPAMKVRIAGTELPVEMKATALKGQYREMIFGPNSPFLLG